MMAVGILGFLLYNYTVFGQRVQAIGSDLQAARFSGISIARYRMLVMTLMGVIAGWPTSSPWRSWAPATPRPDPDPNCRLSPPRSLAGQR